jgi:hypothetical protein
MSEVESVQETVGAAALPAGDAVFRDVAYSLDVLARVDRLGADGLCASGRLEVVGPGHRLLCLLRSGAPLLAAELEGGGRRRVLPLRSFHQHAKQLSDGRATLFRHDEDLVDQLVALFSVNPDLLSSTGYVDPYGVLDSLAQEEVAATVAFEREGEMAVLGLRPGQPATVHFAREADDAGSGDAVERFLLHVLEPGAPRGRLEIYKGEDEGGDPDAGRAFAELSEEGDPPPAVEVVVRIGKERELARRAFTPPGVEIGRDSRCEVFLDNLAVSRRHARIGWEGGRFFIEDLGSANGTRLHGQAVRIADLAIGDEVEIGKFTIALAGQRHLPGVQETMYLSAKALNTGLLLEGEDQRVRLLGSVIVGKGEGVDVTAQGFSVKPVHARIEDRGDGLKLSCFAGAKVKVNGTTATQAALSKGDRLEVGRSSFVISAPDAKTLAEALDIVPPPHPDGG